MDADNTITINKDVQETTHDEPELDKWQMNHEQTIEQTNTRAHTQMKGVKAIWSKITTYTNTQQH